MLFFQNCHPEKQNPDSNDVLVQNTLENFLSELSFESFASLTKNIHLITFYSHFIPRFVIIFLFTRVGYKRLSEMMKMAKIDFQIVKFVTTEDVEKCACVCTCVTDVEGSFGRAQRQCGLVLRASACSKVATIWMTWYVFLKTSRITF